MTTIDMGEDYINVYGHSGYAPEGFDIVCASISTLTESLDRYLRATGNKVDTEEDSGLYRIYLDEVNDTGKALMNEYKDMVDEIVKEYPMYVRRVNNGKVRKTRKIC